MPRRRDRHYRTTGALILRDAGDKPVGEAAATSETVVTRGDAAWLDLGITLLLFVIAFIIFNEWTKR